MAEISIIVPVYNVGYLLEPCIESVLAQTFADWELLLVDDASTDGSLAVCRRFAAADPRIKVFPLPSNRGVSAARNFGIDQAGGTFITFIDGDDRIFPTFLETLLSAIREKQCDIASSQFMNLHPEAMLPEPKFRKFRVFSPAEAVRDALYQNKVDNSVCCKLYRRVLFRHERFSPGRFEDLDCFYRVFLRAHRIALVPSPLYGYTVNPASYMQNFTPGRAVVLDVCERMIGYMEENCPQLVKAAHSRMLSAAFNILVLLRKNGCEEPELRNRCIAIIRRYRCESLFDPRVRLKNKLAILATYLGGLKVFEGF